MKAIGLFTNNHVFDICVITDHEFTIKCTFHRQEQECYLAVGKRNALFTCPVLDVTFISLTPEQLEEVSRRGCRVLCLLDSNSRTATDGADIIVMQYPGWHRRVLEPGKGTQGLGL